jgi:hypothetical protein
MCYEKLCDKCGKKTWSGCGQHIHSLMVDIPEHERCSCTLADVIRECTKSTALLDQITSCEPNPLLKKKELQFELPNLHFDSPTFNFKPNPFLEGVIPQPKLKFEKVGIKQPELGFPSLQIGGKVDIKQPHFNFITEVPITEVPITEVPITDSLCFGANQVSEQLLRLQKLQIEPKVDIKQPNLNCTNGLLEQLLQLQKLQQIAQQVEIKQPNLDFGNNALIKQLLQLHQATLNSVGQHVNSSCLQQFQVPTNNLTPAVCLLESLRQLQQLQELQKLQQWMAINRCCR